MRALWGSGRHVAAAYNASKTAGSVSDGDMADTYTFVDSMADAYAHTSINHGRRQLIRAGWAGTALMSLPQLVAIGLRATGHARPALFLPVTVLVVGVTVMYFTAGRVLPAQPSSKPHPPQWYLTPLLGMWIFQGGAFATQTSAPSIVILLLFAPMVCVWGILLSAHTNTVSAVRRRLTLVLRAYPAAPLGCVPDLVDQWLAQPLSPHRAVLLIRVGYTLENATDPATQAITDEDLATVAFVQDALADPGPDGRTR